MAEPLQASILDSNNQVIGVETIGTKYYSAISYKSIYGESEKNNGYVIIVQLSVDDIENKEADDILSTAFNNYKLEQLTLTNDEYHTVTYVSEKNRDPSTGNYVNSEYYAPFMVTYTFADENPYFEPKYTTQLEVKNLFAFIDYNKIGNKALEICERNGYPNCTNYKPTKEDNLEIVQYAKEDFKNIMPSYQKYVSKDFNDELSKNDYDLEYLTSEGKDVFPTINIDVYDYGN